MSLIDVCQTSHTSSLHVLRVSETIKVNSGLTPIAGSVSLGAGSQHLWVIMGKFA